MGDLGTGVPPLLIDIHTHTYPSSDDSALGVHELVLEAKRNGLDGLCLTDHDRFWDDEWIERLQQEHEFLLVPGCEITTDEGHLLVYGLRGYVFGMHRAAFVAELVRQAEAAMVLAHPYRRVYAEPADDGSMEYDLMVERACGSGVLAHVDGVEVFNGRGSAG